MKTRIIHTKIWKDNWFFSLSKEAKFLFMYLLTNENANMCGAYEINDVELKTWLGFTDAQLKKAQQELHPKVFFKNGWVLIKNHTKYNNYGIGEKQEKALQKEKQLIPQYIFDTSIDTSIHTSMDTAPILDINHNTEIINNNINNKLLEREIVKRERPYSNLQNLGEKEFEEISTTYSVPIAFVRSKYDDLVNYCEKFNKTYKNYKSALRDFVKRDAIKIKKEGYEKSSVGRV